MTANSLQPVYHVTLEFVDFYASISMRDGSTNIALEEQCTINALFMGVSVETMTWVQD
jgi:hypothetical protein